MMKSNFFLTFTCMTLVVLKILGAQAPVFPPWTGERTEDLVSLWVRASLVAVGDMVNVTEYGVQEIGAMPPTAKQDLRKLFWCKATFRSRVVIKGRKPSPPKKVLWATVTPGCLLNYGDETAYAWRATRVWFLREEGAFLRFVVDGTEGYATHRIRRQMERPLRPGTQTTLRRTSIDASGEREKTR